jgi:hypothetical protein
MAGLPWYAGLVLSVLSTVLAYALLRGRNSALNEIDNDSVLELAWLFARGPSDLRPLRDIERPTSSALRSVGRRIVWDAQRILKEGEHTADVEMLG